MIYMIYMSSRRTIGNGEVVTFATDFTEDDGPFGGYDAAGPIEVSASRDAVIVHKAVCRNSEQSELLGQAIRLAESARDNLTDTWRGGVASKYPSEPTPCLSPNA